MLVWVRIWVLLLDELMAVKLDPIRRLHILLGSQSVEKYGKHKSLLQNSTHVEPICH